MDQKRPERKISDKDVCLKENDKKYQRRIYSYLMNCAAPMLTVVFIAGSACWAAEARYGDKEEYDTSPAAAALSPGTIANSSQHIETRLPQKDTVVNNVTENTGAELVEACGIYVDNEFIGAVVNGENIEDELALALESYKNGDNVINADYTVEAELKEGVYRSAALVSSEDMAEYLMGEKEVVKEYKAKKGDTPEKLADDFDMTVEEVKELNPEMEKIEKGEAVKVKDTVSVLPVKYTCRETEEEVLDCDVIMEVSGEHYSGEEAAEEIGEVGKRVKQYEVTYIDGTEVSRELKKSETVLAPLLESASAESELQSESIPETGSIISETFIWPVNGGYVSDPFMSDRNHKGMDIAADSGTDIYAAAGGTVLKAGWNDGGYGNFVEIDHGNGYVTLYGHASEVYVEPGQKVGKGDVIAAVGTTGDSTGNHCHFEVMYNDNYLNPAVFIEE